RKQVLEFDDVMNRQREVIYETRRNVLTGEDVKERIREMIGRACQGLVDAYCDEKTYEEEWDLDGLALLFAETFAGEAKVDGDELRGKGREAIAELLIERANAAYDKKEEQIGADNLRELERSVMLHFIDQKWMEHLRGMDEL